MVICLNSKKEDERASPESQTKIKIVDVFETGFFNVFLKQVFQRVFETFRISPP